MSGIRLGGREIMGLRDHVICDSDLHVMEPPDLWELYIDPAYAHAAPRGLSEITRDMRVRVKNNVMLRMGPTRPQRVEGRKTGWQKEHDTVYAASEARGWAAQSQIDARDAEGLDLAVLFPSLFFNDPALAETYTLSLHDALPI